MAEELDRIKGIIEADANALSDVRQAFLDDVKFAVLGEQWDEAMLEQRKRRKRPALVYNRMPAFVRHVVNGARQDEMAGRVFPISGKGESAELLDRRIRAIQIASDSAAAQETALEQAAIGGFGWYRVRIEEVAPDVMEPRVEGIRDSLAVIWDSAAERVDRSDCRHIAALVSMPRKQFEAEYGEDEGGDVTASLWFPTQDSVSVAEFWEVDEAEKVTCTILSGSKILKTYNHPGHLLPFVFLPGEEYFVEGKVLFKGIVRDAKEPQRFLNFWKSEVAEQIQTKKTPRTIVGASSITGADGKIYPEWSDPDGNYAYQRVNENAANFSPIFPPAPSIPTGAAQEAAQAVDDIKSQIGIYDASLGARSNEQSGKAIMARQAQGELATFHFRKARERAVRRETQIILDLVLVLDREKQWIQMASEDGTITTEERGAMIALADGKRIPVAIQEGAYGVVVKSGPAYSTRREEARELIVQAAQAFPAIGEMGPDLFAQALDFTGANELAKRLRSRMEKKGLIEPKEQAPEGAMRAQMEQAVQALQALQAALDEAEAERDRLAQEQQAGIADAMTKAQADREKIASDEMIALERIASAERIAAADRASKERIAMLDRGVKIETAQIEEEGATERTVLDSALTPPPAPPPVEPMEYSLQGASDPFEGL